MKTYTRKLIINADDFGFCEETNRAVKELFTDKKITSTSLLAGTPYTDDALKIAKELQIDVGAHLTLNSDFQDFPWVSLSWADSLKDENGCLFADTAIIAKQARGKDVTAECRAQIKKITDSGVKIDHLDNHCGTMYGINKRLFFLNAFALSKKYGVPFRFPKSGRFLDGFFKGNAPFLIKALHKGIVGVSKVMGAKLIDDMITNPYGIDEIKSYKALEDYYLDAVTNIKDGVTEMFLHPSYDCPRFSKLTKEWKKREYELEFLYSPKLAERINNEGIELISYSNINRG